MTLRNKLSGFARGIVKNSDRGEITTTVKPEPFANKATRVEPMVSVVVPVYNSMPYLTELLNSLEAQNLPYENFEVVAVDDGSTDFSGEILDIYAKRNPNFHVFHQPNSGWPGKPRNVGIDKARGRYVFFVDGDDRLAPEALSRMVQFAENHDTEVLMPKMVGIGGRSVQPSLFTRTRADADFEFMLRSLSPQKMIRRELLIKHQIRFQEGKVRLEDGMAMVQAYSVASRMSVLADYDYYEIRTRSDGKNISTGKIDPAGYVSSLSQIAITARSFAGPDEEFGRKLCAGLFARKCLRFYEGKRFLKYSPVEQQAWVDSHRAFLDEFIPSGREELFNEERIKVVDLIANGDLERLRTRAAVQSSSMSAPVIKTVENIGSQITFSIMLAEASSVPSMVQIVDRDTGQKVQANGNFLRLEGFFEARMEAADIRTRIHRLGDASVVYSDGTVRRIAISPEFRESHANGVRAYRTANGFLSVDTRNSTRQAR